jgi:hypothetical protein
VLELDLLALAATGIGGSADSVGGAAAIDWFPLQGISFRLGVGARAGSFGASDTESATTLLLVVSAGAAAHPWRAVRTRPFGLSLRADFLAARQQGSLSSETQDSGLLAGCDVAADGEWLFANHVEAVLGLGVEDLFRRTDVYLHGNFVATIPPIRALAEGGVRIRF